MSNDMIIGYLLGQITELPKESNIVGSIIGIALVTIWAIVSVYLFWDIGKISMHEIAKVIWAITFVIGPIVSWIAYYLIVKKGTLPKSK